MPTLVHSQVRLFRAGKILSCAIIFCVALAMSFLPPGAPPGTASAMLAAIALAGAAFCLCERGLTEDPRHRITLARFALASAGMAVLAPCVILLRSAL